MARTVGNRRQGVEILDVRKVKGLIGVAACNPVVNTAHGLRVGELLVGIHLLLCIGVQSYANTKRFNFYCVYYVWLFCFCILLTEGGEGRQSAQPSGYRGP